MSRQQLRAAARAKEKDLQERARQFQEMQKPVRRIEVLELIRRLETLENIVRRRFPADLEERSEGGLALPPGYRG